MLNALGNIAAGREEEASASGGMQRLDSNCTIKTTIVDDLPAAEEKKAIASSSSSSNSSSSSPSSSSSSSISTSSSSSVSNSSSIEQISEKSSSAASSSADKSRNYSSLLKYVSLFVLVLQNAALVLVTRYATTRQQTPFLKSVAVFYNEVIKIVVATLLFFFTTGGSPKKAIRELREKFSLMDTLKLGVPALAYTVQTFLLYVSIENLDAATFMVTYQLKILTTAFFTVLILKRRLSLWQWLALLILVAGVATVQISADRQNSRRTAKSVASNGSALSLLANASFSSSNSSANILSMASNNSFNSSQPPTAHGPGHQQNLLKGFLSVVTVCFLSGFAGVYIEKILKRSKELSIWMQNMQLAMMAIPISLCVVAIQDGRKALEGGFMQGFDLPVWGIVCLQSLGGIATAVVIKYADNILKAFAVAFGIILVTIAAIFLFGIFPKPLFIAGATLVIAAVAIYSMLPYRSNSSKVAVAESESENDEGTAAAGKSVKFEEGKEKC